MENNEEFLNHEIDLEDEDDEEVSSSQVRKYFSEEEAAIHKLMGEIDDLYDETKVFFDKVVYGKAKGTLNFIKDQTSNLITMKSTKLALTKELVSIKKTALELDHKFNHDSEDSEVSKKEAAIVKKLIADMDANGGTSTEEFGDYEVDEDGNLIEDEITESSQNEDDELDKEFERRGIKLNDSEFSMRFESRKVRLVVCLANEKDLKNWEFMAIDKDYNEVEEYPLPNKDLFEMTIRADKTGDLYARDQNDRSYEVVLL